VDPKGVKAVLLGHAPEVRACFDRAAMEHSDLRGRLTIHAVLDPAGQVLSVSPVTNIEGGARLQACVAAAFQSWIFPVPSGGVKGNIVYSFLFD
jgi:hypothetical protein